MWTLIIALFVVLPILWLIIPQSIKSRVIAICNLLTLLFYVKIHNAKHNGKPYSYVDLFESYVDKRPNCLQFIFVDDGREFRLIDIERMSNQVAWWLSSLGLKQKDTVALMMLNRPEFIAFWLGCAKIGVTCSLINTNSSGKTFIHASKISLNNSDTKILMLDGDLYDQVKDDLGDLESNGIRAIRWNTACAEIDKLKTDRPDRSYRSSIRERDPLLYVFTSGTTGLPKASKISHSRYTFAAFPFAIFSHLGPKERVYNVLPLYHSASGMLGVSAVLFSGTTMVIRKKFSARNFASDCVKYQCTTMQYIGELCRYLLTAPVSPDEANLILHSAFGNGMRPDVWTKFQQRYHVQHIIEFYASTEGNLGLFNSTDKVGALGYIPRFADVVYPVRIVKTDETDKNKPFRNSNGRCVTCKPGEVGLLVAEIVNSRVDRRFDGYTDGSATESKILSDVFHKGDTYFNTGDLMHRDAEGYFFWSDRTGDTFRWKGENVSCSEVMEVIGDVSSVQDVVVYGVEIPFADGRAGMAALTLSEQVDLSTYDFSDVLAACKSHLPVYARPLFFRIKNTIETTSTFKHIKANLVKEGFDPNVVSDPLYFVNVKEGVVTPLTTEVFEMIKQHHIVV